MTRLRCTRRRLEIGFRHSRLLNDGCIEDRFGGPAFTHPGRLESPASLVANTGSTCSRSL